MHIVFESKFIFIKTILQITTRQINRHFAELLLRVVNLRTVASGKSVVSSVILLSCDALPNNALLASKVTAKTVASAKTIRLFFGWC